jgi:hypothetical protein
MLHRRSVEPRTDICEQAKLCTHLVPLRTRSTFASKLSCELVPRHSSSYFKHYWPPKCSQLQDHLIWRICRCLFGYNGGSKIDQKQAINAPTWIIWDWFQNWPTLWNTQVWRVQGQTTWLRKLHTEMLTYIRFNCVTRHVGRGVRTKIKTR